MTLRSLLKTAAGRLRLGVSAPRVSGLTSPAKALFAAVAAERSRVLLVVPTDAEVETMTRDGRFFYSALEGLSETEVERVVLPFPSHEVDPYRGLAPHFDIASARARALSAAGDGTAKLIVASASALLPRLSPPGQMRDVSMTLTPGHDISPTDLGDLLAAAGYTRQDPVDEHGEFCVRGGVVDFFPPGRVNRSVSSSSATRLNPYAPTIRPRSVRRRRSIRQRSHRCRSSSATPTRQIDRQQRSITSGRTGDQW